MSKIIRGGTLKAPPLKFLRRVNAMSQAKPDFPNFTTPPKSIVWAAFCALSAPIACLVLAGFQIADAADSNADVDRPNIVFILTDDHRWDSYGGGGERAIRTPNLDRISSRGTRFSNAFVTLAICSPSRAACLTGRYGSVNGVTSVGKQPLNPGEQTFAEALSDVGYATGVAGKWHLKSTPSECGFEFASTCWANGPWYNRSFSIDGKTKVMPGFVDDVAASESIRFIDQAVNDDKPFVLWLCTQVPHMDHQHTWPAEQSFVDRYDAKAMPLPQSWNDDLSGKPEYLKTSRSRTRALEYGYDDPENIQCHVRDYRASVEQMDQAVGRVLNELDRRGLTDNTWIIFMGDNGWFLGEHGFTSKVLPYEESMRVPMAIAGPATKRRVSESLVLNIDLTATIYELAGLEEPDTLHGRSLLSIVRGAEPKHWRTSFLYEAPTPQLGSRPLWAIRDEHWKYVETEAEDGAMDVELYDLSSDPMEMKNVAEDPKNRRRVTQLAVELKSQRNALTGTSSEEKLVHQRKIPDFPSNPPAQPRTDLFISGVYPHLTTYGVYSQNGAHHKAGHNECGIGAIVPWAGKLWMVNYAPHQPQGSEHKLYSVDPDLRKPITIHPESVGGTPAGRMIHRESNQLLLGHHLIDASGGVRTIQPSEMPIRVTAIARHLSDPENLVYYVDMEGSIWEANVHTLAVKRLFKKPVPGWHGKGGYTSQGRLVVSNNGEHKVGDYDDLQAGAPPATPEERGVLAEFDGSTWRIVERRQYTEVTGPKGITGGSDANDPIWAMGWDRRSVRLKVLDNGVWSTFLLPKAAYCNDAKHGWYTEWPRIREITGGKWMMDMHGMFFQFPKTFSSTNSAGIRPIGSHLRYVPDFCDWNGKLVLATDETSIQGNPLAGQPQSNLWFGDYDELKTWGPASGYGGPWVEDRVKANVPSDPFLVAGFDRRMLHLAIGPIKPVAEEILRTTDQLPITKLPPSLAAFPRISVERGDWRKPSDGFEFRLARPASVYVAVDGRGDSPLSSDWERTDLTLTWGKGVIDSIYVRRYPAGVVAIPGNAIEHSKGAFGTPPLAFVDVQGNDASAIEVMSDASMRIPVSPRSADPSDLSPVSVRLQVDRHGDGKWADLETVRLATTQSISKLLPGDLNAEWLRLVTDRDCIATAVLHQTTSKYHNGDLPENRSLFAGLADVGEETTACLLYPAKRNRNLRLIADNDRHLEFTKSDFLFEPSPRDAELRKRLHVEPEFSIDDASVIVTHNGMKLRLPKGDEAFDRPFAFGWPRASREVESERHLANIHGTFYELPLITNGAPPAWNLARPVSSHSKQISDFCSWNGLLVLSGVRPDAEPDGHVFRDKEENVGLWFGGVDDLWKLGKPRGEGGPWLNTKIKAKTPSDPYLMRGYDEKTVTLSHDDSLPLGMTLQIDLDGTGRWIDYRSFEVPPRKELKHEFSVGFSAAWIRAICEKDATATVQFHYR